MRLRLVGISFRQVSIERRELLGKLSSDEMLAAAAAATGVDEAIVLGVSAPLFAVRSGAQIGPQDSTAGVRTAPSSTQREGAFVEPRAAAGAQSGGS